MPARRLAVLVGTALTLALLDPATGLPSDNLSAARERSRYTSPTNIGAYLWSTLAAGIWFNWQLGARSSARWSPTITDPTNQPTSVI